MSPGNIIRMVITVVALSSNELDRVMSTVARRCYRMVIVAMGKDAMPPNTVATKGHSNDGRFGDITDKPL
jgi:hypothetical protein